MRVGVLVVMIALASCSFVGMYGGVEGTPCEDSVVPPVLDTAFAATLLGFGAANTHEACTSQGCG